MNKKRKLIILGLTVLIILILFAFIYYKTQKNVNNINKSTNEIARYILNISSYEAYLEVKIESNKNTNKYEWNRKINLYGNISKAKGFREITQRAE